MSMPITILTGAGGAIGRAVAILLAAQGHHLAIAGRTKSKLEETALLCAASPGTFIHCSEIRDEATASTLVDAVIARWGRVDNLVNCAGVAPMASIEQTTDAMLLECFGANTFGPAHLIMRCWPLFQAQKSGRIVNVSTLATTDPFPGFFAYAASKSALDSLTRSAAREGARIGVKVFGFNLGCIETPLLRQNFSEKMIPRARALAPEVAAQMIVDSLSGKRDADHGKCIPVPSP